MKTIIFKRECFSVLSYIRTLQSEVKIPPILIIFHFFIHLIIYLIQLQQHCGNAIELLFWMLLYPCLHWQLKSYRQASFIITKWLTLSSKCPFFLLNISNFLLRCSSIGAFTFFKRELAKDSKNIIRLLMRQFSTLLGAPKVWS